VGSGDSGLPADDSIAQCQTWGQRRSRLERPGVGGHTTTRDKRESKLYLRDFGAVTELHVPRTGGKLTTIFLWCAGTAVEVGAPPEWTKLDDTKQLFWAAGAVGLLVGSVRRG